uniref:Uncharacterized protein n=1 Tax=Onchocerca volvulus TaxID=6282 RepID=A0A8R1Y3S3_ONCVO
MSKLLSERNQIMPEKMHFGGLFLGDTIQEKTRTLLGWNDELLKSEYFNIVS